MKLNRTWLGLLGLTVFFGWTGLHRIGVGKAATGLLMLFTMGGFIVFWLFDIFLVVTCLFTDDQGRNFPWLVPAQLK